MSGIPDLKLLCVKNIAVNIVRHGINMTNVKRLRKNNDIRLRYEALKKHFSQDLLTQIDFLRGVAENEIMKTFDESDQFLLFKRNAKRRMRIVKECLELLFNEYTRRLSFNFQGRCIIPRKLITEVLPLCTNLKILKLNFYSYGTNGTSDLLFPDTLVTIDLLHSFTNDRLVTAILQNCPNVRVFKASGKLITDEFLNALCSKHSTDDTSQCNGGCCERGNNLTHLLMHRCKFGLSAIENALRHLPLLEVFTNELSNFISSRNNISSAVSNLRNRSSLRSNETALNLRRIEFTHAHGLEEIRDALDCCPRLESLCFNVSPQKARLFTSCGAFESLKEIQIQFEEISGFWSADPHFRQFLVVRGHQLHTISFKGHCNHWEYTETLKWSYFCDILDSCANLKRIFFVRCVAINFDLGKDYIFEAEKRQNKLEEICISEFCFTDGRTSAYGIRRFFRNLLSVSPKLRHLGVSSSSYFFENCVIPAMNSNNFSNLQRVSLRDMDLENVSLTPLINNQGTLRKVLLWRCLNTEDFIEIHRQEAEKCNYLLHVGDPNFIGFDLMSPYLLLYNE